MSAGQLRDRAAFYRRAVVSDGLGHQHGGWESAPYMTVWARLKPTRGREALSSGVVSETRTAELMIRESSGARSVTAADSVVISGQRWNIRSGMMEAEDRAYRHFVIETRVD